MYSVNFNGIVKRAPRIPFRGKHKNNAANSLINEVLVSLGTRTNYFAEKSPCLVRKKWMGRRTNGMLTVMASRRPLGLIAADLTKAADGLIRKLER